MSRSTALRFLTRLVLRSDTRKGDPVVLRDGQARIRCDVYPTVDPPWGTVIVIHGATLRAHQDPRIVAVCRALSRIGVQAVAPRIAPLAELKIGPEVGVTLQRVVRLVTDDRTLVPCRPVGMFAASFAAGQVLRVAGNADLRDRIGSLMLIGPYADPLVLLRHVLTDPAADRYGRLLILARYLDQTTRGVSQAIDTALRDLSLRRDAVLPSLLADLSIEDRQTFVRLSTDPAAGHELLQRILSSSADEVQALSVLDAIPNLLGPVALLHGRHDAVIPASESVRIARELTSQGLPNTLHLTRLLDHGDLGRRWLGLAEARPLLRLFAGWFDGLGQALA